MTLGGGIIRFILQEVFNLKALAILKSKDDATKILQILNPAAEIFFVAEDYDSAPVNFQYQGKNYLLIPHGAVGSYWQSDFWLLNFCPQAEGVDKIFAKGLGVAEDKIFNLFFLLENDFAKKILQFRQFESEAEKFKIAILGGLSALADFDLDLFNLPVVNFSAHNQDLYTDYLYLKKILSLPNQQIKYLVLNLQPYALRFDLSQSEFKFAQLAYYPIFKDLHNLPVKNNLLTEIFNSNFFEIYRLMQGDVADFKNNFDKNLMEQDLFGARALNKKYLSDNDKIFQENLQILNSMIELCKRNDIQLIISTLPEFFEYRIYFPQDVLVEFQNAINKLKQEYKFYYLDYRELNLPANNFCTAEILNPAGAKNFTPYISNLIDKLENKKIKIAFTLETIPSWDKIIPLFNLICENPKFDVYGVILPNDKKASPTVAPRPRPLRSP